MTTQETEKDWITEVGKPAYEAIAEMVAALECDYDRLEEMRDEFAAFEGEEKKATELGRAEWPSDVTSNAGEFAYAYDVGRELAELEKAAGECEDREAAEQRIQEDALSIEVRSGWTTPGEDMTAEEFNILLTTGGPAVRIMGELDQYGEPSRAWLEVQDWGKPWSQYFGADQDTLLTYARCFVFAS